MYSLVLNLEIEVSAEPVVEKRLVYVACRLELQREEREISSHMMVFQFPIQLAIPAEDGTPFPPPSHLVQRFVTAERKIQIRNWCRSPL